MLFSTTDSNSLSIPLCRGQGWNATDGAFSELEKHSGLLTDSVRLLWVAGSMQAFDLGRTLPPVSQQQKGLRLEGGGNVGVRERHVRSLFVLLNQGLWEETIYVLTRTPPPMNAGLTIAACYGAFFSPCAVLPPLRASLVLASAGREGGSRSPAVRAICLGDLSPSQGQNDWGRAGEAGLG